MKAPVEDKVIVMTLKPKSKLRASYDRDTLSGFYKNGMYYHTANKHPLSMWAGDIESWEYFE